MMNNHFFTTEIATAYWLHSMGIENYIIREDLTVDVDGSVNINSKNLDCIPVQFGEVIGEFHCYNNNLTTLKGSPWYVEGYFDCHQNQLTSLKYGPIHVGNGLCCSENQLISLKYFPTIFHGCIICNDNQLKNLDYLFAKKIEYLVCDNNHITFLKNLPMIESEFYCHNNPITNFNNFEFEVGDSIIFTPIEGMEYLDNYKIEDGHIEIDFQRLKQLIKLKPLHDRLTKELPIENVNPKNKISKI